MQNWKATCPDGFTKTVMANTKEDAVALFMADAEVQEHFKSSHPEMASKSPEEVTAMAMTMVQPVPATA